VAALSAIALTVHLILVSSVYKRAKSRLFSTTAQVEEPDQDSSTLPLNLRDYVAQQGGNTIFAYKVARLFGCLALLGLSICTAVLPDDQLDDSGKLNIFGRKKRKYRSPQPGFLNEWLGLAMCMTYVRISLAPFVKRNMTKLLI